MLVKPKSIPGEILQTLGSRLFPSALILGCLAWWLERPTRFAPGIGIRRGVAGAWSAIHSNTIDGDLTPPAAVSGQTVIAIPNGYQLSWTNPTDDDFGSCCIYQGTTSVFSASALVGTVAADYFQSTGLTAGAAIYLWIRAKDRSGNLSASVGPLTVTPAAAATGSTIHDIGTNEPPLASLGIDGDLAIATSGNYYIKDAGAWTLRGNLIGMNFMGAIGATVTFLETVPPDNSFGSDGDVVVGTINGEIWDKASGAWVKRNLSLTAPTGLTISGIFEQDRVGAAQEHEITIMWTSESLQTEVQMGVYKLLAPFPPTGAAEVAAFGVTTGDSRYSPNEVKFVSAQGVVFRDVTFGSYRVFRARAHRAVGQQGSVVRPLSAERSTGGRSPR